MMAGLLVHTTMSEALRDALDTWKVRRCSLTELRKARALPLRAHGASLEAMVGCVLEIVWKSAGHQVEALSPD